MPPGHAVHDAEPGVLAKVSAGHALQVLDPGVLANVPAGHGAHGSVPPGPNVPALHVASVVVVTAVQTIDPGSAVVPGGHATQDDEPGVAANVSLGHTVQTLDPDASANVPGRHGEHGSTPPAPKLPGAHGAGAHDVEPVGAVVPTGHTVHRNAPDVLEKVSTGHGEHTLDPAAAAKLPGGQLVHGSMPPGPDVPGPQTASVVVVTGVHAIDPGRDVVPTGHAAHVTVPKPAVNVSAGHGLHALDPAVSA